MIYFRGVPSSERATVYDITLDTPEEIRYKKKVAKLADELAEGRLLEISMSDPSKEKGFRDLAREKLRTEGIFDPKDGPP